MARRDGLDELTTAEQEALKVVVKRLLQADPRSSTSAMSHVTLLGLDPSTVEVGAFDPTPGGRVELSIGFSGCTEGIRPIEEAAEDDIHMIGMEPAICCAPFAAEVSATVEEGGRLVPDEIDQRPYIRERCCGPVEEELCR